MIATRYFDKANVYFFDGKYEEAIKMYTMVIHLKSDYTIAYINQGNAYQKLKKYELAEEVYSKV